MPTDPSLLADIPFFQTLDDDERAALAAIVDNVSFPKGATIFHAGDPGDAMYILRSGEVEIYFKDDTGIRILLETARAGDFFGDISLFDGGPRTASVVVTEDVEAILIDRNDIDQFLTRKPRAALDLLTATGRRLRQSAELLRHTASRNVNEEIEDKRTAVAKIADWIAEFSGSIPFLVLHLVWFGTWISLNVRWVEEAAPAVLRGLTGFDPFPFGLLTMVVSLEAIVLSVFVLLSQNRQVAKDRIRSDVEYEVNLKAELEVAHLHEKFDLLRADVLRRLDDLSRRVGKG